MKSSVILFLALCISVSVQQQIFGEELVKQTLEWGENEGHISKAQVCFLLSSSTNYSYFRKNFYGTSLHLYKNRFQSKESHLQTQFPNLVSCTSHFEQLNHFITIHSLIWNPDTLWRLVHAAGSKITLLNVLYFGGTLLVIGAMTLFMTLGFGILSYSFNNS